MTITRRAAVTLTDMRTAIRREVRDPVTTRAGTTRASATLRWSNDDIDAALNQALEELQHELSVGNPGERLLSVDTTYSSAQNDLALPAGITSGDLIYKVERITDESRPEPIEYVSPLEIERFAVSTQSSIVPWSTYRYTIVARGTDMRIAIRPEPASTLAIRISYLATATIVGAAGDAHPHTSRWFEFLVLSAAEKLLRPDDEFSGQQRDALERHRDYIQGTTSRAGPQRIRSRRRFT